LAKSLYRNHVIVASGEFNQVTRQWKSMVCIFWKTDTQKLHSISDRQALIESLRVNALNEIFERFGMEGVERLAGECVKEPTVGITLAKLNFKIVDLAQWITDRGGDFGRNHPLMMTIRSLIRASETQRCTELINAVLEGGKNMGWDARQTARFLALPPENRATWDIVISCGPDVEKVYWLVTQPSWLDDDDLEFALRRLIEAARPRTALQVCHFDMKKVEPQLLVEILEGILRGEELDERGLDNWEIGEALEDIESSGTIDKARLIRLEFGLIRVLGYDQEQKAKTLFNAIMSDPKLFCEVLCILYKPNGKRETPPSEAEKTAASIVWRILHSCRRQPGARTDGTIDPDAFVNFIGEARDLSRSADRLEAFDLTLGQILAHAPTGTDGVWPFAAARNVLDRPELEDVRRGFVTGVFNSCGSSSRAYDEGGAQERELAEKYRLRAAAVRNSHPNLAAAIEKIARFYEADSLQEDTRAELRREGIY
jgi:hypothetical protein